MNLALFHFIRPYWLLALIPLAIITGLLFKHKLQRGSWVNVCDEALLPYILQQNPIKQNRIVSTVSIAIASVLAIFALAGPTWERIPSPAFRNDSSLVIALDLSRSMDAGDIKPSRLTRARFKIADILKQRKDGQTALLVYAGDAFTVTPLTNDNATIASQLEALTTEIMPSAGNNTTLAVEKAVELLKQAGLQTGQILLVTDGINADETAAVITSLGNYQLSVLAVGTEQGAPISLASGGFLKDESGTIVVPKLPVQDLKKLASAGHGIYQPLTDNDSDIKTLLAAVDNSVQKIGDNSQNNMILEKWDEKGVWLLLLVLPLAALSFRRGLLGLAFLLILPIPKNSYALEWQDLWQTKDQQAQQAFNHKQYDKAAKLFEDPAWQAAALYRSDKQDLTQLKTPKTATGFYNQGNVFAKAAWNEKKAEEKIEKFTNAIKSYDQALKLEPNNQDAKFNKALCQKELKKMPQAKNEQKNQQDNKGQDNKDDKNSQDNKNKDSKDNKDNKGKEKKEGMEKKDAKNNNNQDDKAEKNQKKNEQANDKEAKANKPQDKESLKNPAQKAQAQQAQRQEDEQKQANEQWLNRIPDDPAGLLRRKFKYQYGQRQQQTDN